MTEYSRPTIGVSIEGSPEVSPTGGQVQLAAMGVPYATATVVLPLTPDTLLDDLDPRDDQRVVVNGSNTGHWA